MFVWVLAAALAFEDEERLAIVVFCILYVPILCIPVGSAEEASQPRADRRRRQRRRVRGAGEQRAQVREQGPYFLGVEHRRLDQQGRRPGRNERRVELDEPLRLLARARGATQVGRRRRSAGRQGFHSHRPLLPIGQNIRLAHVWRNVTLT